MIRPSSHTPRSILLIAIAFLFSATPLMNGCSTEPINTRGMSSEQLLVRGDNLLIEGRRLKEQGEINGDDVTAHHGEELIQEGRRLKAKAIAIASQGHP